MNRHSTSYHYSNVCYHLPLNTKKNIDSLKMIWQEADMVKNEMIALAKSTSYCQDWLDYIRFKESSIMDTSVVNQITNTLQLYQTLQNQNPNGQ